MKKTILLDYDGVLSLYEKGWEGADTCGDEPTLGAIKWLADILDDSRFEVCIYSSRSRHPFGVKAMSDWLLRNGLSEAHLSVISFPTEKPAAFLTIDDRCIQFNGEFPTLDDIANFVPWNKRPKEDPGPGYKDPPLIQTADRIAEVLEPDAHPYREEAEYPSAGTPSKSELPDVLVDIGPPPDSEVEGPPWTDVNVQKDIDEEIDKEKIHQKDIDDRKIHGSVTAEGIKAVREASPLVGEPEAPTPDKSGAVDFAPGQETEDISDEPPEHVEEVAKGKFEEDRGDEEIPPGEPKRDEYDDVPPEKDNDDLL